jgi:hypothetical protein
VHEHGACSAEERYLYEGDLERWQESAVAVGSGTSPV